MKANGGVFISYQRNDESKAAILRNALRAEGFKVWWDKELQSGEKWEETIDDALKKSQVILVLWSTNSISSKWVAHEASIGKINDSLIQVHLDDTVIPKPFQAIQAVDLSSWNNQENDSQFRSLVDAIRIKRNKTHRRRIRKGVIYLMSSALVLTSVGSMWLKKSSDNEELSYQLKDLKSQLDLNVGKSGDMLELEKKLKNSKELIDHLKDKKSNNQPVLRIENIKSGSDFRGKLVRVIAKVNDYSFSYPTQSIWLKLLKNNEEVNGYSFSSVETSNATVPTFTSEDYVNSKPLESFILPIDSYDFRISFSGFLLSINGNVIPLVGDKVIISKPNNKYEYVLKFKDDKSNTNSISVVYSINPTGLFDLNVQQKVDKILDILSLQKNFILRAADVRNAAAVIRGGDRYILYNPSFMSGLSNDNWSGLLVLAHEISHHVNGHTLSNASAGDRINFELAADKFSGSVLARLGATLEQTLAPLETLIVFDSASLTHPSKEKRIAAARSGWISAQ